ncbi:ribonuclease P/MRP protein subunit POP5 [Leptopilina boulardi]|uniref:ribonuclease P/MRP protein subunit POP5 n=1 Tax=Leptopilina boulardi TaxID=63433 RepID=UPI0021F601C1|nr:ribonuclease P/MRP protein subunit POP5 [Leptopilina boulardi]
MVRFKNRYFTLEITSAVNPNKPLILKTTALHHAIQKQVHYDYGDFGQAAINAGFNAKYCNAQTGIALVKVRHGPHKFLLTSVPNIKKLGDHTVNVKILYVGATLRHCFLFVKKHQQKKLDEIWKSLKTDEQRQQMEDIFLGMTPAMKDFK